VKVDILRKLPWKESTKSQQEVNKRACTQTNKNRLSTRFEDSATFASWLGFLSNFSAFLEAYKVVECVSHPLEGKQPIEALA